MSSPTPLSAAMAPERDRPKDADAIFERYFAFVWRNARRLGVPEAAVDDAVQDVFLVVHRRLREFEARSSIETWLFGILLRVAQDYRRAARRHNTKLAEVEAAADLMRRHDRPDDIVDRHEAVRFLYRMLDELDEDKRAIFVLVELEEMAVTEAAEAARMNVNTAYARLRAARQQFDTVLARHQPRQRQGQP